MQEFTWQSFAQLMRTQRYQKGAAESDEKSDGIFGGMISALKATKEAVSISVEPCMTRSHEGWDMTYPEGRLISSTSYDGVASPSLHGDGSISYFVFLLGRVTIYPEEHPKTAEFRALCTRKEVVKAA